MGGCWLDPPPGMMSARCTHTSLKNRLFSRPLKKRLRGVPASLFNGFVSICLSFWGSCCGCFSPTYENPKTVFGLRRRVRIACPTCQKTAVFEDFASHFLVFFPKDVFFCTFWAPRTPKPRKVVQKGSGNTHVLGLLFEIWSHFSESSPCSSGSVPNTENSAQNYAKSFQKRRFLGGPMCDPYTPAQSKHTFCMSSFL